MTARIPTVAIRIIPIRPHPFAMLDEGQQGLVRAAYDRLSFELDAYNTEMSEIPLHSDWRAAWATLAVPMGRVEKHLDNIWRYICGQDLRVTHTQPCDCPSCRVAARGARNG